MRADVFKIEKDSIKLITSDDKILNVSKSKIDFKCKVGDTIIIGEKDGKECYLPISSVKKSKKKGKKGSKIKVVVLIIVCLLLIAGITVAAIVIPQKIEENQKKELEGQLNSCLYNGHMKLYPNDTYTIDNIAAIKRSIFTAPMAGVYQMVEKKYDDELKNEEYDMAISCYNKYQVENYQEKIKELQSYKKEADLSICVRNAQDSSKVSDEELESAKNDTVRTIALMNRLSNGYQEQINCYEKYNTKESNSKISELRSKKSEMDSYIESARNSTVNTGSGRTGVYCTTNTIGNYTYTNCY